MVSGLQVTVLLCALVAVNAVPRQSLTRDIADLPGQWMEGCWKDAYGRGVGTIPGECPGQERDGALCYPWCKDGYDGVGPVCWQNCPSGWRDDGAFCFKPSSYGRGAGYTSQSSCERSHSQGCETWGLLWYPKCAPGFYAFGCCVCSPVCPAGMTDIGVSCAKDSYGRGAGSLMKCASDQENDAGLCYKQCDKGYDGVGPVCWSLCPKRIWKYECGALCYNNDTICDDKVLGLIRGALDVFLELLRTLNNPSEEQFKDLLKKTLNELTGYLYPYCSERMPKSFEANEVAAPAPAAVPIRAFRPEPKHEHN